MDKMLLYPMAFYVFYVFFLFTYIFKRRLKAVKTGELDYRYYKNYADKKSVPGHLMVLERHIDNQFQLPMIFLISCLAHLVFGQISVLTLILAWLFVISRLLHSYIHLGKNNVYNRAKVFGFGALVVVLLWVELVYKTF